MLYMVGLALVLIIVLVIICPYELNVIFPENLWVSLLALGAAFAGLFASYMLLNNEEKEVKTLLHSMQELLGNGTLPRLSQGDRPIHPCHEWIREETYV